MKVKHFRKCRVIGCVNRDKRLAPDTPLFRVPNNNVQVLEKWVQESGDTDWHDVPIKYLKENLRLCARHFLPDQLLVGPKQTRLKVPVAPTIFDGCEGGRNQTWCCKLAIGWLPFQPSQYQYREWSKEQGCPASTQFY